MSDRVAVFANGRIEQVDSPRNLYQRPQTRFVAEFVGGSNVLADALAETVTGERKAVSVRPEHIRVLASEIALPDGHVGVLGRLVDIQYHGATSRYEVEVDGRIVTAALSNRDDGADAARIGQDVRLAWPSAAMVALVA
nr:TOBE domain-containing protein [Niveibacterium umoris]